MRECLRHVAEEPGRVDVELLRVEPERGRDLEQPLHQVAGALHLADDRQRRDQPERADQERALLAGHSVIGLVGLVAQDEAVLGELVRDREDGCMQPPVVPRQEPEDGCEKHRGVQRVSRVVLAEHAAITHPVGQDVGVDLVGDLAPGGGTLRVAAHVGELGGTVHRHPAHELGRHVVLRRPPRLPDSLVGLCPHLRGALGL